MIALAAMFAAGGCTVHGRAYASEPVAMVEVDEEPPPPRYVQMEVRPGFVFIQGHWERQGGRWAWRDGYYERERAGYSYEQGRWDRRGNRHVWVQGRWNARPEVQERREQGPVIRDHR